MSHAHQRLRDSAAAVQGNRCYYCSCPMWHKDLRRFCEALGLTTAQGQNLRCTAEHLHARRDGGKNTPGNVVAACSYCNRQRHKRPKVLEPAEYRRFVQRRMASGRWLIGLLGWAGRDIAALWRSAPSEA